MTYQIELTSAAFTPTATATASPTATHTPTVTSTPTATRTPLLSIYLPIIMLDEAPGG